MKRLTNASWLCALLLGAAASSSARADTLIWTDAGADLNWSTGDNWTNSTAGTTGTAPSSLDDVRFFNEGTTNTANTPNNYVDLGFAGTINSLWYGNSNVFHTTVIPSGQTLSITGDAGLMVETPIDIASGTTVEAAIVGEGAAVVLNNINANVAINQGAQSGGTPRATLNMTGLDTFTANASRIGIGTTSMQNPGGVNQRDTGTLYLAKTNLITLNYALPLATYQAANATNALEMAKNPGNNSGRMSYLYLGQTNAIFIDSLGIGRDKASATSAALMTFNPAFTNNNPVAYFRGIGGDSSRVTWWALGDMNANASSAQVAIGTNDFSHGTLDALVDVMSLGRDCGPNHTATGNNRTNTGVMIITSGTLDVNTLYLGNQSLGPATSLAANMGVMNVIGAGARLIVNGDLFLGRTVQNSTAAANTRGVLNVRDGTVCANNIPVGAVSTLNIITMNSGTLFLSNSIASPARSLHSLFTTNSSIELNVTGITNICTTNLVTGGDSNVINLGSVAVFAGYPAQIPLISYAASFGGAGFNFVLGEIPASAPGAYLLNNVANKSIDLVLPNDPRPIVTGKSPSYGGAPGDDVNFSVTYTGVEPLTFQWMKDGADLADGDTGFGSTIAGSTTSSLYITNAQQDDSGSYTIVIANVYGATTSAPPNTLIISTNDIAPFVDGPYDVTVIEGNNATFSASVSGKPLPDLQWQRDSVDIEGATSATLVVTNVQYATDNGAVFSIVATNVAGTVVSNAVLTVIVPPVITSQPASLIVTNTQSATFTVAATGVPAPTYQWLKNNAPITGATSDTYTIASTAPSDAAVYSVRVQNAAGLVTSSNATLLVNSTMSTTTFWPANGATGICPDTVLRVTFDRAPVIGTAGRILVYNVNDAATPVDTLDFNLNLPGGIQGRTIGGATYNTYPVIISGNTANIYLHNGVLTTNETYYVIVENVLGGAFKDSAGATFAGISATNVWQFTTKAAGPADENNIVVAADGSGDFCTVQGAVDYIPADNATPRWINIRNGFYQEIVFVNNRTNLTFMGQDRDQTQISYANNDVLNGGTSLRPSFRLRGADNVLANLTLTNATPKGGSQAECLRTDGSRLLLLGVKLASYQDTILCNNLGDTVYVQDSLIQGDTDYMWGSSTLFVTNTELRCLSTGSILTQNRTTGETNGFSFVNCTITRASGSVGNSYLGRILGYLDGNVAYIGCRIDSHIVGWQDLASRDWEYGNSNLTATAAVTYNGIQLPSDSTNLVAASDASAWLYGWLPQFAPYILTQPASLSVTSGNPAALTVSVLATPNPDYTWVKDGTTVVGTGATLTIANAQLSDSGSYSVIISNVAGAVTSSIVSLTVSASAPVFTAPAPNSVFTVNAGSTLLVTNTATDADLGQTLSFSLLAAPGSATIDPGTGVFSWRPLITEANSSNVVTVVVTDDGTPNLSATNAFSVIVDPAIQPTLGSIAYAGGQFGLTVNGQVGPDYAVQVTTNLVSPVWETLFTTNSPAMPFTFLDPNAGTVPLQFYRVVVGPPLP